MLVFWHCLNLNGPQFDCEINTSLRLIVGVGCHSHHFQSYCLSGMQKEPHQHALHLLNPTVLCISSAFSQILQPEEARKRAFTPLTHFPHLLSHPRNSYRKFVDLEPNQFTSMGLIFFLFMMVELTEFPKVLSAWLCLDQQLASSPSRRLGGGGECCLIIENMGIAWKIHNS